MIRHQAVRTNLVRIRFAYRSDFASGFVGFCQVTESVFGGVVGRRHVGAGLPEGLYSSRSEGTHGQDVAAANQATIWHVVREFGLAPMWHQSQGLRLALARSVRTKLFRTSSDIPASLGVGGSLVIPSHSRGLEGTPEMHTQRRPQTGQAQGVTWSQREKCP